jgi:hypothetical protein
MNTVKAFVVAVLVATLLTGCDNPDDGPNAKRSGQEPNSDPTLGPGAMRGGQAPLGMSGSGSPDSGASNSPTPIPTNPASLTDARMPNSPSQPDAGPTGSILDALLGTVDVRPAGMADTGLEVAPTKIENFGSGISEGMYFLTITDEIAESVRGTAYVGCPVLASIYDPKAASRNLRFGGNTGYATPLRFATYADIVRLKYPQEDFPRNPGSDGFATRYINSVKTCP